MDAAHALQLAYTLGALAVLGVTAALVLSLVGRTLPARLRSAVEERAGEVARLSADLTKLRGEWGVTLEEMALVRDQIDRRRKQLDTSAKRAERANAEEQPAAANVLPIDQHEALRRALGVGGHFGKR